jgi:hypothetical protein
MLQRNVLQAALLASAMLGAAFAASSPTHAASFVVINADGAGEGFNDNTAAAPVGNNPGTTVGQQRLIAFQRAADIWAARLASNVPIRVHAQFNPLSCTATGAVLGSAGAANFIRDFGGAPRAGTWYPVALANALAGTDLDPGGDDISAEFNSKIGTAGCLESSGWYYGLDGKPPGNRIDFVAVLLHEMGHGLGFATLVSLASGAKAAGFDDAYMVHLENHGATPPDYPSMSDAQRVAASKSTGNLHWTGTNVRATAAFLTAGRVGDHVRMFAPDPQRQGSSVSHWDTELTPSQLMEPSYTGPTQIPVLEMQAFRDIGWTVITPPSRDFDANGFADIGWVSNAGKVRVWLWNGETVGHDVIVKGLPAGAEIAGIGDLDGDGKLDIVYRDGARVKAWLMNGSAIKQAANIRGLPATSQIVGVGDVDDDGRADIISIDNHDKVSVWLMHGGMVTDVVASKTLPAGGTIVGVGDVNGDGRADIVYTAGGKVKLWLMNAGKVDSAPAVRNLPANTSVVGVGDVDGDAKADLVLQGSDGKVSVWLMSGATVRSVVSVKKLPAGAQVVGLADVDGDGKADILYRRSNGQVQAWTMNGGAIKSTVTLGTLNSTWTVLQ